MNVCRGVRGELLVAAAVFVLGSGALSVLHDRSRPHYSLSSRQAVAAVRADRSDAEYLAHHHITGARTIPFDNRLQSVAFFDGSRTMLGVLVDPHGHVVFTAPEAGAPKAGSALANSAWILALFSAVFMLATMVVPLWRLRNLDALALAGLTADILLVNAGFVWINVLVSASLLTYLALRCLSVGVRRTEGAATARQVPLFDWLTARCDAARRLRLLRFITAGMLVAVMTLTLTSVATGDVATASLAGATDLLHWQLPYGHIAAFLHGDTYPLLTYVFYIPGAMLSPVLDAWSEPSGASPTAAVALLATAVAIWLLARRIAGPDRVASTRAVLAWLAFPPMMVAASSGTNDMVLAAVLAWMLALAAHAGRSTLLLVIAVWTKVVPLVLVPLWFVRGRRERIRALLPAIALSLLLCGYLVGLGGAGAFAAMVKALSYQFTRGSFDAPWYTFSVEWLQPIVQAAVLATLVWVVLALRRIDRPWLDGPRVAGLCGCLLLGMLLAGDHWPWRYLPWAFPFVAVALLVDRAPARIVVSRPAADGVTPRDTHAREPQLV